MSSLKMVSINLPFREISRCADRLSCKFILSHAPLSRLFLWYKPVVLECFINPGPQGTTAQTMTDFMQLLLAKYTKLLNINLPTSLMLFSRRTVLHGVHHLCRTQLLPRCYFLRLTGRFSRCDERFVGYGGNKAACLFEMYLSGVSFYVLSDHFLVHQNHLYEEAARKQEVRFHFSVPSSLAFICITSANITAKYTQTSRRKLVFGDFIS